MSRTKIDIPSKMIFTTDITPRISDINYGGHLGHDSIISLTHEARVRFFSMHNYSELDIEGLGLIMSDLASVYKSESFYGDIIRINIGTGDIGKTSFELIYVLENHKNNQEIARVRTRLVFFNYNIRKTMEIPKEFLGILLSG